MNPILKKYIELGQMRKEGRVGEDSSKRGSWNRKIVPVKGTNLECVWCRGQKKKKPLVAELIKSKIFHRRIEENSTE